MRIAAPSQRGSQSSLPSPSKYKVIDLLLSGVGKWGAAFQKKKEFRKVFFCGGEKGGAVACCCCYWLPNFVAVGSFCCCGDPCQRHLGWEDAGTATYYHILHVEGCFGAIGAAAAAVAVAMRPSPFYLTDSGTPGDGKRG